MNEVFLYKITYLYGISEYQINLPICPDLFDTVSIKKKICEDKKLQFNPKNNKLIEIIKYEKIKKLGL